MIFNGPRSLGIMRAWRLSLIALFAVAMFFASSPSGADVARADSSLPQGMSLDIRSPDCSSPRKEVNGKPTVEVGQTFVLCLTSSPAPGVLIAGFQADLRFPEGPTALKYRQTSCNDEVKVVRQDGNPLGFCTSNAAAGGVTITVLSSAGDIPLPPLNVAAGTNVQLVELDFSCNAAGSHTMALLKAGTNYSNMNSLPLAVKPVGQQSIDLDRNPSTPPVLVDVAATLTINCQALPPLPAGAKTLKQVTIRYNGGAGAPQANDLQIQFTRKAGRALQLQGVGFGRAAKPSDNFDSVSGLNAGNRLIKLFEVTGNGIASTGIDRFRVALKKNIKPFEKIIDTDEDETYFTVDGARAVPQKKVTAVGHTVSEGFDFFEVSGAYGARNNETDTIYLLQGLKIWQAPIGNFTLSDYDDTTVATLLLDAGDFELPVGASTGLLTFSFALNPAEFFILSTVDNVVVRNLDPATGAVTSTESFGFHSVAQVPPPDEQININVNNKLGQKQGGTCWVIFYVDALGAKVTHDVVGDNTAGVNPDCGVPSNVKLSDKDPAPGSLGITITSAQRVQFGDIWHVQMIFSPVGDLDLNKYECDLLLGKCEIPKVTVGGLVVDLGEGPQPAAQSSGSNMGVVAGMIGAVAAGTLALGGAAWYARRRL